MAQYIRRALGVAVVMGKWKLVGVDSVASNRAEGAVGEGEIKAARVSYDVGYEPRGDHTNSGTRTGWRPVSAAWLMDALEREKVALDHAYAVMAGLDAMEPDEDGRVTFQINAQAPGEPPEPPQAPITHECRNCGNREAPAAGCCRSCGWKVKG